MTTTTRHTVPSSTQYFTAVIKDYIPLFQSLVWPLFWLFTFLIFRKQIVELFYILLRQVEKGASVRVGLLELKSSNVVQETADLGDNVETVGEPDRFELLFKAQGVSKGHFFVKSTKAMKVPGGCVVQVTSELQNPDKSWSVAESLAFVPGNIDIEKDEDRDGQRIGRFLKASDV